MSDRSEERLDRLSVDFELDDLSPAQLRSGLGNPKLYLMSLEIDVEDLLRVWPHTHFSKQYPWPTRRVLEFVGAGCVLWHAHNNLSDIVDLAKIDYRPCGYGMSTDPPGVRIAVEHLLGFLARQPARGKDRFSESKVSLCIGRRRRRYELRLGGLRQRRLRA